MQVSGSKIRGNVDINERVRLNRGDLLIGVGTIEPAFGVTCTAPFGGGCGCWHHKQSISEKKGDRRFSGLLVILRPAS